MERIYILGGDGFLGKSLQNIFSKKNLSFKVGDISNKINSSSYLDITDIDTFNKHDDFSTIINLAAEHKDNVKPISKYFDVNVEGAKNVCKYAEEKNINKIIFVSSVAVYGFSNSTIGETGEINYFNEYGRTKYLAEKVYEDWYLKDQAKRCLIIIRPTVIFGEGNRGNVYNLMKQISQKKFLMIGNGKNIKSIAYVHNVSEFIHFSLSFASGFKLFNYSDLPDYDMNSLVTKIQKTINNNINISFRLPVFFAILIGKAFDFLSFILKKDFAISEIRIKKFISSSQFKSRAISDGFEPTYSLDDALEKTIKSEFNN